MKTNVRTSIRGAQKVKRFAGSNRASTRLNPKPTTTKGEPNILKRDADART
jgi:hypothetical protein